MLYAALTFWLLVIVFSAWGVHWLWSRMIKPRAVNTILLPGTLVAQLGHVMGLLVTGNSVQNTTLMGDDDEGEPQSETPEKSRVPVIGPIIIALLPLAACTLGLFWAAEWWGQAVIGRVGAQRVAEALPTTLAAFWALLRESLSVTESMFNSIVQADWTKWTTVVFVYLSICLTVRMTPFEGNRRGAIGAILFSGLVIGALAALMPGIHDFVLQTWPVLSFAVGMLLFLLLASLLISGLVGLVRILAKNE